MVRADLLGAICLRPKDYLDATKESPFDPMRQVSGGIYRRQVERQEIVRAKAKLQMLFAVEPEEDRANG